MRVDPALLVASALLAGSLAATSPGPACAAAGVIASLVFGRVPARVLLLALIAFGVGWARGSAAIAAFEDERVAARDALGPPGRCALTGKIVRSPVWMGGQASYELELERGECDRGALPAPMRIRLYGGPGDLRRGDRLEVIANLGALQIFRNHGVADPTPRAARAGVVLSGGAEAVELVERGLGLGALIDAARAHARRRILATFALAAAPMARALVLGENDLDPEDGEAFRLSGLSHILAVSGTHLVFAVVGVVRALTFVLVRIEAFAATVNVARFAALFGAGLALLYADFAGGSGSAWRAAFMLAAGFGTQALGRRPSAARTFAASMFAGALLDPLVAFDVSFLLSLAATAGLIAIGSPLASRCEVIRSRPLKLLAGSVVATVSAMIPCAPLLAALASGVNLAGIVANVVAAPFGECIALPLCLSHALFAPFPELEQGAALVASGALLIVKKVAHASAAASLLTIDIPVPNGWQLALVAVFATGVAVVPRSRRRVGALGVLASFLALFALLELSVRRAGRPGELRVTALDVGQGDATLVDFPDGSLMLIDAGGFVGSPVDTGKASVLPVLRARRRERIDVVVLSHPHPDHFGGLASVIGSVAVGEFWDTGQGRAHGAGPEYAKLMALLRERRIPIKGPAELCGERRFGGARLELLAPCPTFFPERSANDNSFVFRVVYGAHAALFVGDAEHEAETELLRIAPERLRAEFLKVGHHGSRTSSSPDFLAAVRPRWATLSCGVRNRFGHPHPETMASLAAASVVALRLDRHGSVVWTTNGSRSAISAFASAR